MCYSKSSPFGVSFNRLPPRSSSSRCQQNAVAMENVAGSMCVVYTLSLQNILEYTRITAPSTHPCPSAIEDVFALDDRFMTARQIALHHRHSTNGTCDKECMYAWILRCRTTQASLSLHHDCRAACSTASTHRRRDHVIHRMSSHVLMCLLRSVGLIHSSIRLSTRNMPRAGEQEV